MSMSVCFYAVTQEELKYFTADDRSFTKLADSPAPQCDLDKSWHGLHYLLSGKAEDAPLPRGFIFAGGEPIETVETCYGPPCWFAPEVVQQIHAALAPITDDELWSRFDPAVLDEASIYPMIWDEDEENLREEYLDYFHQLNSSSPQQR